MDEGLEGQERSPHWANHMEKWYPQQLFTWRQQSSKYGSCHQESLSRVGWACCSDTARNQSSTSTETTWAETWELEDLRCGRQGEDLAPTLPSAKALMQLPKANRERLMLAPSRKRAPRLVVTVALSEPARSMRDILATWTSADMLAVRSFWRMNTWKRSGHHVHRCPSRYTSEHQLTWSTAWEREDSALASVGCWVRFRFPQASMRSSSSADVG